MSFLQESILYCNNKAATPNLLTGGEIARCKLERLSIYHFQIRGEKLLMKPFQRILAALTLTATLTGPMAQALSYEDGMAPSQQTYAVQFSDVPATHWAFQYIADLVDRKAINGYPNGLFYPGKTVSREEFAKILAVASACDVQKTLDNPTGVFTDVKPGYWATPYIEAVSQDMTGYPDGDGMAFRPKTMAVREDMAVAIAKMWALDTSMADESMLETMFSDTASISPALKPYVAAAVEAKIINGYADGTFGGQRTITRAEAAAMLWRALANFGIPEKNMSNADSNTKAPVETDKKPTTPNTQTPVTPPVNQEKPATPPPNQQENQKPQEPTKPQEPQKPEENQKPEQPVTPEKPAEPEKPAPTPAPTSYRDWKKDDGRWANESLGNGTMASNGGLVTALSIAMVKSGKESESSFNPSVLLQRLKSVGGFTDSGALRWAKVSVAVPGFTEQTNANMKNSSLTANQKAAMINDLCNKGYTVVVQIPGNSPWGLRYVTVDSVNGDTVTMHDPNSNETNLFAAYGNWPDVAIPYSVGGQAVTEPSNPAGNHVYIQQQDGDGCYIASAAMVIANYRVQNGNSAVSYGDVKAANGGSTYMNWNIFSKYGLKDRDVWTSKLNSGWNGSQRLQGAVDALKNNNYGLMLCFKGNGKSHAVTVIGYENGNLIVCDPARNGLGGDAIKLTDCAYIRNNITGQVSQEEMLTYSNSCTWFEAR